MSEYTPNEKRLKMFGAQAQGYAMDRVDMYLDKLEGAYTQLREAYEQMKNAAPVAAAPANDAQMQEVIALNARLQQEAQNLRNENDAMKAKVSEVEARVVQLNTNTAAQPQQGVATESAIAKALLSAQEKAKEILRGAQLEAQGIIATAHSQVDHLKAEKMRARNQIEGIRYALEGLLADQTIAD